jgi:hypothetical protein
VSRTTFRLAFDSQGNAYAATDTGLFRFSPQPRAMDGGSRPYRPGGLPAVRPTGHRRGHRGWLRRD